MQFPKFPIKVKLIVLQIFIASVLLGSFAESC